MENNSTLIPAAGKKRRTYNNRNNANNNNNGLSLAQRKNTRKNNGKRARGNSSRNNEVAKRLGMSRTAIESMARPVSDYVPNSKNSIIHNYIEKNINVNEPFRVNMNKIKNMNISIPESSIEKDPRIYSEIPFYYITQGKFNSLKGKEDLRAVILDNDETTGYYMGEFKEYIKANEHTKKEYKDVIYDLIHLLTRKNKSNVSLLRPGYSIFFKKLRELKDANKLDAVIMYTNMEKKDTMKIKGKEYNRPQLLAAVFDIISGGDGSNPLFDLLIFRDKIFFGGKLRREKYIAVIDEIFGITGSEKTKYLFFDDKPEAIMNNKGRGFIVPVNEHKIKIKGAAFTHKISDKSIIDLLDDTFSAP
jgi:hypothetical protein